MNCDADDPGYKLLNDEAIVNKAHLDDIGNDNNEEEEKVEILPQAWVSYKSAMLDVERLIKYLKGKDIWTLADDLTLHKFLSQIRVKCHNKKKQMKFTKFLTLKPGNVNLL